MRLGTFFPRRGALMLAAALALVAQDSGAQTTAVKTLSFSGQPPLRQAPLITGVAVHFGIGGEYNYVPAKAAAALADLGVDSFRDDLPWGTFEGAAGRANPPQPRRLFDFMAMTQARPLLILGHSNPEVPGGVKPLNESGRAAFADYTVRAMAQTRKFGAMYEIWNEWNLTVGVRPPWLFGAGTADDPRAARHYAAAARNAIAALRDADPGALILSGSVGGDPGWDWTKAIVKEGALKGADGLSVHLYNHCEPDVNTRNATELADRASELQRALRKQTGGEVPLYVTEFGWPTVNWPCVIPREAAADYIAQFLLWSAATPWIKGAWMYELKDQGKDPREIEQNFGLFDYDYNPKPAVCTAREAIKLIKGSRGFRLERPFKDFFLLQTTTDRGVRLVAWTTRAETRGLLRLTGAQPSRVAPLCNLAGPPRGDAIEIGTQPVVIDIDAPAVTATASMVR